MKTQIVDVARKDVQVKWGWVGHVCSMPIERRDRKSQNSCPEITRRARGKTTKKMVG